MNKRELFDLQISTFKECASILERKNQDYAGDVDDALANFKAVQLLGITSPVQGVLVRLTDKFMRVINVLKAGGAAVSTETAEDTINDTINYLIILKSLIREQHTCVDRRDVPQDAAEQIYQGSFPDPADQGTA